jgi:SPP1 gp7 family putative phage head morphogenesis protein
MNEPVPVNLSPVEAIRHFIAKGFAFSFAWEDVWQAEHARYFTMAKVLTRDVAEALHEAITKLIAEGGTVEAFARDLRPTLEELGWWGEQEMRDPVSGEIELVQLGSPRRLKFAARVNLATSYAQGRWQRIERNKTVFPWLEYVSVMDGRERKEHGAWHGTRLPVDHPWWDSHFPPNGWNCRCIVKPVSRARIDRLGLTEQQPPVFRDRRWVNKRTGEVHSIETGIDPGWSYHVGKAPIAGFTPDPWQIAKHPIAAQSSLSAVDEELLTPFFAPFGLPGRAAIVAGRVWRDAGGWPLAISADWFTDGGGGLALPRGLAAGDLGEVAAAIMAPLEIRWHWVRAAFREGAGEPAQLVRRYIGRAGVDGKIMVVDVARWWRAGLVSAAQLDRAQRGTLAWSPEQGLAAYNPTQPRHPKGSPEGGRFALTGRSAIIGAVAVVLKGSDLSSVVNIGDVADNAPSDTIGYRREVSHEMIWKVWKKHGQRGHGDDRVKLRRADFAMIPQIVSKGQWREVVGRNGKRTVEYRATIGSRSFLYVETVGRNRERLRGKTFFVPNR